MSMGWFDRKTEDESVPINRAYDGTLGCGCDTIPRSAPEIHPVTGHTYGCPNTLAIMGYQEDGPRLVVEDRGIRHRIWVGPDSVSFDRIPTWSETFDVSVPIGWSLRPDLRRGVVLSNLFGQVESAATLLALARQGRFGFRLLPPVLGVTGSDPTNRTGTDPAGNPPVGPRSALVESGDAPAV